MTCVNCKWWYRNGSALPVRCQQERNPCFMVETPPEFGCVWGEASVVQFTDEDMRAIARDVARRRRHAAVRTRSH